MLHDTIHLMDGSIINNATIQSGASLPTTGRNLGEIFFRTTDGILYVFNGTDWISTDALPTKVPRKVSFSGTLADAGHRVELVSSTTIPANIYAAGDAISFFNNSASPVSIFQGANLVLRLDGTATTGDLSLAQYGTFFLWFSSPTLAVASGSLTAA